MHRAADLDALLDQQEPHATFHDAELLAIRVNYQEDELVADWRICVGNPDSKQEADRERRRSGRLILRGLAFWVIEPPADTSTTFGPLWLTADGPLSEASTATGKELARQLPGDAAGWYLYFSDLNAFAYCAARSAHCQWV